MNRHMRSVIVLTLVFASLLLLAACGASAASGDSQAANAAAAPAVGAASASNQLSEEYKDALPAASQLILGSLKLEESDQPIDKDEAAQLLPLWQAYQSLSNSDNTAEAELAALVKQIEGTMQPAQVEAIADMQLTAQSIPEVLESQGAGLFGGGFGGRRTGGQGTNAGGGGFQPPPGGFIPGEGPGGGPGGGSGGGFAQMSPEQRATAIAERGGSEGDRGGAFMTRGLVNALITSLRLKTGDLTEEQLQVEQAGRGAMRWVPVASEATGIALDKLSAAMSGGKTLAEAIQGEGGDVAKAEAAIREVLKNVPNLNAQAIEDQVSAALKATAPQ